MNFKYHIKNDRNSILYLILAKMYLQYIIPFKTPSHVITHLKDIFTYILPSQELIHPALCVSLLGPQTDTYK